MKTFVARAWSALFLFSSLAHAIAQSNSSLPPVAAADYLQGMEALQRAEFGSAIAHLTRAVQGAPDSPELYQTRGVAETLAEQFPAAIADLQRASQLDPQDPETKLWLSSAYRMSGHPEKGTFVHAGLPANYADMVYNQMAMDYLSSLRGGGHYDRAAERFVPFHGVERSLFPKAAAAYAARHKAAGPEAADLVKERMKSNLQKGNVLAALPDLQTLLQASPDDVSIQSYWAVALLALGDARDARREFTRILGRQPLWLDGYAGRAEAATIVGDGRRAQADLQLLASVSPKAAETARTRVERLQKEWSAPSADAPEHFEAQVGQKEVAWSELVRGALALRRWENSRRDRYDEGYQQRIAHLSLLIKNEPERGQWRELLAHFLFANHRVPRLWNGPRGEDQPVRPQSQFEQNEELSRTTALANQALQLDPKDVNSIADKALVAFTQKQDTAAEQLADEGLAIDGRNLRLLTLKDTLLLARASALGGRAGILRMGHSSTRRVPRSDGVYEETIHYPPTEAELAEAAGLEKQAAALRGQAERLEAEAARIKSKLVPDLLAKADAALRAEHDKSAGELLEAIYRCDPDLPGWPERMAQLAKAERREPAERVFTLLSKPLSETTAASALHAAWDSIQRTAYEHAEQSLDEAQRLDPADARSYAYRSACEEGKGDESAAHRQRRAALALEEARAWLMGTSFLTNSGPSLTVAACGLSIALRLKEGQALLREHAARPAFQTFAANLILEKRVGEDHTVRLVPSAMLPQAETEAGRLPTAPSFGSLMAWSRLGLARASLELNQPADALAEFQEIREEVSRWPATAPGSETMNEVDSWARLGLAQAAYESKDYNEAFRLLMSGEGWPWRLPPELVKEKDALSQKVVEARKHRSGFGLFGR